MNTRASFQMVPIQSPFVRGMCSIIFAYLVVFNLSEWFYAARDEAEAELYATSYVETALENIDVNRTDENKDTNSNSTNYASMRRLLASDSMGFPDGEHKKKFLMVILIKDIALEKFPRKSKIENEQIYYL